MNVVMIIPTGIGCEIGGHNGDATPVVKMLGQVCDNIVIHPNVVNASDINEMPDNALYVEGSMLDRFLEGDVLLKKVRKNKILVVTNPPLSPDVVNTINAFRVTSGIDVELLILEKSLEMDGYIKDGIATGDVNGHVSLLEQVMDRNFDCLAISSPITIDNEVKYNYVKNGGINPWGGVEAILSKLISKAIDKPVAHAPIELDSEFAKFKYITDPRIAPEMISSAYLISVLKGLCKAPRIAQKGERVDLINTDIDFMISPWACWGRPHDACKNIGISIIFVLQNRTVFANKNLGLPQTQLYYEFENYLEVTGFLACERIGMDYKTVLRPLGKLRIS